jgi:hypothetical protein
MKKKRRHVKSVMIFGDIYLNIMYYENLWSQYTFGDKSVECLVTYFEIS